MSSIGGAGGSEGAKVAAVTLSAGVVTVLFLVGIDVWVRAAMDPRICPHGDILYGSGSSIINNFYLDLLGAGGTPAVGDYAAFLHRRPSQMPLAWGHSIGDANATKADTLFAYLTGPSGLLQTMVARQE